MVIENKIFHRLSTTAVVAIIVIVWLSVRGEGHFSAANDDPAVLGLPLMILVAAFFLPTISSGLAHTPRNRQYGWITATLLLNFIAIYAYGYWLQYRGTHGSSAL